jgi:hypothetical protein
MLVTTSWKTEIWNRTVFASQGQFAVLSSGSIGALSLKGLFFVPKKTGSWTPSYIAVEPSTETIVGIPRRECSGRSLERVSEGGVAPITKQIGTAMARSSQRNSKSERFEPIWYIRTTVMN